MSAKHGCLTQLALFALTLMAVMAVLWILSPGADRLLGIGR